MVAFSALAFAAALGTAPASAEVLFTGSAAGCFGSGCTNYSSTATDSGLTFNGSTFSGTTLNNVLFVGTAPASPNVNNFGSLTLSSTGNHDYSNDVFNLAVTFTQPTGTTPNPGTFTVDLQGKITGDGKNGSVGVVWLDPIETFNSSAGSFTLDLNNVSISPGGSVPITGELIAAAVPEASTWAMMILGFCGLGFMAYRKGMSGNGTIRFA
jgi:hypothetical protein